MHQVVSCILHDVAVICDVRQLGNWVTLVSFQQPLVDRPDLRREDLLWQMRTASVVPLEVALSQGEQDE